MYETSLRLLQKISSFGYKAYIIGGYPRDLYLKRSVCDIDICTDATPMDIKNIFKEVTKENPVIKGMPNIPKEMLPDFKLITNKPILPQDYEIEHNKRSKSAKLRVIERIK